MSNSSMLDQDPSAGPDSQTNSESGESFADILSQYEQTSSHAGEERRGFNGTVVAVTADSVLVDIGFKTEGILPLADFTNAGEAVKRGDKVAVSIKGRDPEGYYELSRLKVERPRDWSALEKAFADKAPIAGMVTAVVKGGLSVDVGVRAFMPASRSGAREAADVEKLVGQEIRCRIIKLDTADEDVVVDRRAVLEDEEREAREKRYSQIKEGETVTGTVRSLTDFGAFVDIGGVDALLHVADISWGHVAKPADVLKPGQELETKVLKVDAAKRRISIGLKQLLPHHGTWWAKNTRSATACRARSRGWRISARSSSSKKAWKGLSTFRKCRGRKRCASRPMPSNPASRWKWPCSPSTRPSAAFRWA